MDETVDYSTRKPINEHSGINDRKILCCSSYAAALNRFIPFEKSYAIY